jgi:hypothetical protein
MAVTAATYLLQDSNLHQPIDFIDGDSEWQASSRCKALICRESTSAKGRCDSEFAARPPFAARSKLAVNSRGATRVLRAPACAECRHPTGCLLSVPCSGNVRAQLCRGEGRICPLNRKAPATRPGLQVSPH